MNNWYYTIDGDTKTGPVDESQIRELLARNELTESTLLWSTGMHSWRPLAEIERFKQPAQPPELLPSAPPPAAFSIPTGLRGWLTFLGMCLLCCGVLACLSLVGILTGIPLVIAGTALLSARSALNPPVEMDAFLSRIRTTAISVSVLFIASILLFLLTLLILVPLMGATLAAQGSGFAQLLH